MEQINLMTAIAKLVLAGEQAGFTVEQMIQLLQTGTSIEVLLSIDRMAATALYLGALLFTLDDVKR